MNDTRFSSLLADLKTQFNDISQIIPIGSGALPRVELGTETGNVDDYYHYFMGESGYTTTSVGLRFLGFKSMTEDKYVYYVSNSEVHD